MRIVEDTSQALRLRDRTLWITAVCLAGAALAVFAAHPQDLRSLVAPGFIAAFGLAFLRATDVVFDKLQETCAIRRLDVFRVRRTELAFADITDVRVEPSPGGDDSGSISCRLALVTGQATVPLSASYEPNLERYNAMRETIADTLFAGRAHPAASDPVMSLVAAGRGMDAVAFLRRRDGLSLVEARDRVEVLRRALQSQD